MLRSLSLRDYMLKNPATVRPEASVIEAINIIIENRISGLCVVDGHGHLVGVLSEMDCLRAVLNAVYNKAGMGQVCDYMTHDKLITAPPEEDIVDIAQDMLANNMRRRPVVDGGRLVGQITCRQLLKAVRDYDGRR